MNDREMAEEARARLQRATEREARALEHQHEAERKADAAGDPESARAYRDEAATHARAARLHRDAIAVQATHEDEHS
jgi:hypothetical protein